MSTKSSVQNGIAVSKAQLVIQNGDGYDTWMDKLLSASPNPNRTVLVAADIADHKLTDNPHFWYGIDNIQTIAGRSRPPWRKSTRPTRLTFEAALTTFEQSLTPIQQKMGELKSKYAGTPVGLTETIFLYQTGPMGLNVLTPFALRKSDRRRQ